MSALLRVDGFFADLCARLAAPLRDEARRLPFTLGLAPEPLVPWSRVFSHEVTLAAPWLFAEGMPPLPGGAAEHALFAHALAVIAAMGADRIADGQARRAPALPRVLAAVRAARDDELACAAGRDAGAALALAARADATLAEALREEREVLRGGRGVAFVAYEALSERKQAPGLVATVVLAARAGWDERQVTAARRALLDVALGLQLHDDVVDWEDDAAQGCAWALALARAGRRAGPGAGDAAGPAPGPWTATEGRGDAAGLRAEVHAAGVLARMLRRARLRFRAAARRAAGLGAGRLAAWADERASALDRMARREARHAGYVHRAHALAPWARAVLGWAQ